MEMGSFALFHNAQVLGKRAACLLTISDSFVTGEKDQCRGAGLLWQYDGGCTEGGRNTGKRQAAMK